MRKSQIKVKHDSFTDASLSDSCTVRAPDDDDDDDDD